MHHDTTLIQQILTGDQTAFEQLCAKYNGLIQNLVRRYIQNPEDIQEIAQDVWLKVFCNLSSLRTPATFPSWLKQITTNEAHSFLRRKHPEHLSEPDQIVDTAEPIDSQLIKKESDHNVLQALEILNPLDRNLLKAHYIQNISYTDLQTTYNLSYKSITMRIYRAKKKLKNHFLIQFQEPRSPIVKPAKGETQMKSADTHPHLFPAKQNGKWGYIDPKGQMIIPPQFDRAMGFAEGLARVANFAEPRKPKGITKEKAGYIDGKGELIIPLQFEFAYAFSEGLAAIRVGDKHGYIDKTGDIVIAPQFDQAEEFKGGFATVQIDSKWGYINTSGKIIIEPEFDQAWPFNRGLGTVLKGRAYIYFDTEGKVIWWPKDQVA